jgi:parallel beta-helix repeat protein
MSAYTEAIFLGGARETIIANNTLSGGNTPTAILAYSADANVIRGNRMPRNGIWILGDGNRIERNDVVGSTLSDKSAIEIVGGQANLVLSNRAHGFGGGIAIGPGASATRIVGNVANASFDDGIDVDAPGTVVRANTANNNGDLGIEAIEGTIDGGGNRASGNGNPLQCVNVVCH